MDHDRSVIGVARRGTEARKVLDRSGNAPFAIALHGRNNLPRYDTRRSAKGTGKDVRLPAGGHVGDRSEIHTETELPQAPAVRAGDPLHPSGRPLFGLRSDRPREWHSANQSPFLVDRHQRTTM